MALTDVELADALRIDTPLTAPFDGMVARINRAATAIVASYIGSPTVPPPDDVVHECIVRVGGYLFDNPASMATSPVNILVNTGVAGLLSQWREIHAVKVD